MKSDYIKMSANTFFFTMWSIQHNLEHKHNHMRPTLMTTHNTRLECSVCRRSRCHHVYLLWTVHQNNIVTAPTFR
jgi:hypothetical protein